jgi:hypothetical protein
MNKIYIDVPSNFYTGYKYDWRLSRKAEEVLRIQEEIAGDVKFVCNNVTGISNGDVYALTFETPEDLTYYLVKNKFDLIDKDKVDRYKLTHG